MSTSEKILEEKRKRMMHLMVSDINEEEKKEFEKLILDKELTEYIKEYSLKWLEELRNTNRLSEKNRKRLNNG
ncbi:hypothetical protein M0R19_07985 [Candidatus Pacearchaeota archaeon]|nr:hypothetical protein [Candidatus Pacearchaeota archaeon]